MAIVHVTTAQEFIDAIAVGDNEVYVDNDIDFNGIVRTREIPLIAASIHGQNHAITNINYTWPQNCFMGPQGRTVTIEDLNFTNVYTDNDKVEFQFFDGNSGGKLVFNRCKFQGLFYQFTYRSCEFYQCAFAFEDGLDKIALPSGSKAIFQQCYFDLKEQTTGTNNYFEYASSTATILQVLDCYFKGTIKNFGDNAGDNSRVNGADPLMQVGTLSHCVFNLDITDSRPIKFNYWDNSTSGVCIYNETKVSAPSVTATTDITGLPNSDMQVTSAADVERVSQAIAATGFPIVY